MFGKKKNIDIVVLGSNGMFGFDFCSVLKARKAYDQDIGVICELDRKQLDDICITQRHALDKVFNNGVKFDICVNCIAMTDTKFAENTLEGKNKSYVANALIPKYIAESCIKYNVKLVHISTDYVFGGMQYNNGDLYTVSDTPYPCCIYGQHKLLGEQFIENEFLRNKSKNYAICRVSWLYGDHRQKSFVHKILKAAVNTILNNSNESLYVTENEYSIPTSTKFLSDAIIENFIKYWSSGIFHIVPSMEMKKEDNKQFEYISRYSWAREILHQFKYCEADIFKKISEPGLVQPKKSKIDLYPEFSVLAQNFPIRADSLNSTWKEYLFRFMDNNFASLKNYVISCYNKIKDGE